MSENQRTMREAWEAANEQRRKIADELKEIYNGAIPPLANRLREEGFQVGRPRPQRDNYPFSYGTEFVIYLAYEQPDGAKTLTSSWAIPEITILLMCNYSLSGVSFTINGIPYGGAYPDSEALHEAVYDAIKQVIIAQANPPQK